MDYLPIVFLIIFVLVGGGVAIGADELGRRIGKRKLTLHRHIRPKTSARILAFLWGIVITVVTMVLIGAASSDMRTLLLQGRFAIRELEQKNKALRQEQDRLSGDNRKLVGRNKLLATQFYEEQNKLHDAEAKLRDATYKASQADLLRKSLDSKVAGLTTRYSGLQRQFTGVNTELLAKRQDLLREQRKLSALQTQYNSLDTKNKWLSKDYASQLEQGQALTIKNADLEKQIRATEQELNSDKASIVDLNSQKKTLEGQIQESQNQLDELRGQLSDAENKGKFLEMLTAEGFKHTRFQPILYDLGEELTRAIVPARSSKDQARAKIEDALEKARTVAKSHGAKEDNGIEYAGMIDVSPQENGFKPLPVDTQKDLLASDLAGSSDEEVIIVYAMMNSFANEGVVVGLAHKPNPVVYQPNQVLAEVRVDSHQEPVKILETLDGLGGQVRKRAIKDKMIPIQKGDLSFGSVTSEDILKLFSDIQKYGGNVRVQAVTKRLTRAADPLELAFYIK